MQGQNVNGQKFKSSFCHDFDVVKAGRWITNWVILHLYAVPVSQCNVQGQTCASGEICRCITNCINLYLYGAKYAEIINYKVERT